MGSREAKAPDAARATPYGRGRLTPQRQRIAAAAASLGAFTVEDLAARLRQESPRTGLATIYRAVRALETAGSIHAISKRGSSELYVWCIADEHHHHVVCTRCGAVEHASCPFGGETWQPADVAGYTIVRHEMTLFGMCAACVRAEDGD